MSCEFAVINPLVLSSLSQETKLSKDFFDHYNVMLNNSGSSTVETSEM